MAETTDLPYLKKIEFYSTSNLPAGPGGPRGPWVPIPGLPRSPFSPGEPGLKKKTEIRIEGGGKKIDTCFSLGIFY